MAIVVACLVVGASIIVASQLRTPTTATSTSVTTEFATTTLIETSTISLPATTVTSTTTSTQSNVISTTLTSTITKIQSTTLTNTVVETRASTFTLASGTTDQVTLSGEIVAVYKPLEVLFTYYPCNPAIPFQPPGPTCATIINASMSAVTSRPISGGFSFSANFSAVLPNNQSYIVAAELQPQNSTQYSNSYPSDFTAAYLPLFSNAPSIAYYNIQCNSEALANQSLNSAPVYCYTHYANTY